MLPFFLYRDLVRFLLAYILDKGTSGCSRAREIPLSPCPLSSCSPDSETASGRPTGRRANTEVSWPPKIFLSRGLASSADSSALCASGVGSDLVAPTASFASNKARPMLMGVQLDAPWSRPSCKIVRLSMAITIVSMADAIAERYAPLLRASARAPSWTSPTSRPFPELPMPERSGKSNRRPA
jgi:hypothetical protein